MAQIIAACAARTEDRDVLVVAIEQVFLNRFVGAVRVTDDDGKAAPYHVFKPLARFIGQARYMAGNRRQTRCSLIAPRVGDGTGEHVRRVRVVF